MGSLKVGWGRIGSDPAPQRYAAGVAPPRAA